MKRLYFCFNFWKKQIKYSCPWKQNVWKRLFEATWAHLISNFFSATQPWWVALLDIHFRFFVPLLNKSGWNVCFWVVVVKNRCGLFDHGTLKSAVSQEKELIKWADFVACWYKFRKANVNFIIIRWAWSKMGKTFRLYGTLKSGASHIWFD